MTRNLEQIRIELTRRPELAGFDIHIEQGELHLEQKGERFARLIPVEAEYWRMEYFQNTEKWEIRDIQGTLEECLDFLLEQDHFRFWNR